MILNFSVFMVCLMLFRFFYQLLWLFILPVALLRLFWRSKQQKNIAAFWPERLGFFKPVTEKVIWLHAVSVGEVVASQALVEAILIHYPDYRLVLSNTTATGRAKALDLFGNKILQVYVPYDFFLCVKRSFSHLNPELLIVMETELWPSLLHCANRLDVPVLIANARLSPKSAQRYKKTQFIWKSILKNVSHIAARNDLDRAGFLAMGAQDTQVSVLGNLKYDVTVSQDLINESQVRKELTPGLQRRFIWCFASSHAGEDELALAAHQCVLKDCPDALLIIVPRHPERFSSVAELIRSSGFNFQCHSINHSPDLTHSVFLLDAMGLLMSYFCVSDLAVIGGSYVNVGGHNPIEPASIGIPVLSGPMIHNFRQEYQDLLAVGGAEVLREGSDNLAKRLIALANDPEQRHKMGCSGLGLVNSSRGVVDRVMQQVTQLLPKT